MPLITKHGPVILLAAIWAPIAGVVYNSEFVRDDIKSQEILTEMGYSGLEFEGAIADAVMNQRCGNIFTSGQSSPFNGVNSNGEKKTGYVCPEAAKGQQVFITNTID